MAAAARIAGGQLPRLLYAGDVAVEASFAGSALLYRLLQHYPVERLRIIESNLWPAQTSRQLPGVVYQRLQIGGTRLLATRFHDLYSRWLLGRARGWHRHLPRLLDGFAPQAVLTVGHGYAWMAGAAFAERERLPLHLIVHDDWPRIVPRGLRARVDAQFARVYRQAASRLCVSPFMVEEYERRYEVRGTVMLPQRSATELDFAGAAPRLQDEHRLVFAFAGTINSPGTAAVLRMLATVLASCGAELWIFGPLSTAAAAVSGLDLPNVRLKGLLAPAELSHQLRDAADVLFVPMSFAESDQPNIRINFPSKLADYTAVGLPILICGPEDCSAVRWATANPGVAETITVERRAELQAAVDRLCGDRQLRLRLAETAQQVGRRDFAATAAEEIFHDALMA